MFVESKPDSDKHINDIAIKLNRANGMLYKVSEFLNTRVLKLIYHTIFDCHLNYANTEWGQNKNSLNRVFLLGDIHKVRTQHFSQN